MTCKFIRLPTSQKRSGLKSSTCSNKWYERSHVGVLLFIGAYHKELMPSSTIRKYTGRV